MAMPAATIDSKGMRYWDGARLQLGGSRAKTATTPAPRRLITFLSAALQLVDWRSHLVVRDANAKLT